MKIDPLKIIEKYYQKDSPAYKILVDHSQLVSAKAMEIGKRLLSKNSDPQKSDTREKVDLKFLEEAAMLHDIGILFTHAPDLGCHGDKPYISHGYLGRELLEKEGLPKHALVCERHTGTGITKEEIIKNNLPLPHRNMEPKTLEEQIICYADKFFSKNPAQRGREKNEEEIIDSLAKFGPQKVQKFLKWHKKFS